METVNQRIVKIDGLAQYLQATRSNVRRLWRQYPHFFVGTGTDLKAARFDISDVLLYLKIKKGVGYERMAKSKNKKVEVQIRTPKAKAQEGGVCHSKNGDPRGGRKADQGECSRSNGGYPLTLLRRDNPRVSRILQKTQDGD